MDQAPVERSRPGVVRRRRFLLLAMGLLLFAGTVFVVVWPVLNGEGVRPAGNGEVVWLSSEEVARAVRASQSSEWTRLKSKVLSLASPLLPEKRSQAILLSYRFWGRLKADEIRRALPQRPALCTNAAGVVIWKLSPTELAKLAESASDLGDPFPNLDILESSHWQRQPWELGQLDPPALNQALATKIGDAIQLVLLLNPIPGSHSNSITGFTTAVEDGGGLLFEFPGEGPCRLVVSLKSMTPGLHTLRRPARPGL